MKEKRLTFGFFLVTLAGLYTHYFFSILWFLTFIWVLINSRQNHFSIRSWLKFSGLITIFLLPLIYQITQVSPLIGILTNPILKFPAFYLTPVIPWNIALHLPIINSVSTDMLSLVAACLALTGVIILLVILTQLRRLTRFHALAFAFFMAPAVVFLLLHLGYPIAGLRSFAIFFPCFLFLSGAGLGQLNIFKRQVIAILITILSVFFLVGYVSFYTGKHDSMTSFYQHISSSETIAYSDIVLFLPTRVLHPKGKHIALHPGYLDASTLNALGVSITPYTDLQLNASLWYVKQRTNWPPFDDNANKMEAYFADANQEVERKQIGTYELIRYEKLSQ